tara:strand:- start:30475 stop:30672 length:198 start_codon:yes stop_codon:yes gene_type:complete
MTNKILVRRKELLEVTGITRYQLKKFLKAGVLKPVKLPDMHHYYYRINEVQEILGGENGNGTRES